MEFRINVLSNFVDLHFSTCTTAGCDNSDGLPSPAALRAMTRNLYSTPGERSSTRRDIRSGSETSIRCHFLLPGKNLDINFIVNPKI